MMEPSEGSASDMVLLPRLALDREETEIVRHDNNTNNINTTTTTTNNNNNSDDGSEDDDDSADDDDDESDVNLGGQNVVGGTIRTPPAVCLLDGFLMDDAGGGGSGGSVTGRVTVPILRLPVTVGRAHTAPVDQQQQQDSNFYFVGLGGGTDNAAKAVSRQHIRIDYRVALSTGKCGFLRSKGSSSGEESSSSSPPEYNFCMDDPISVADIIHIAPHGNVDNDTNANSTSTLPETGFFTLTVVGRNRVLVQSQRIESGQTVRLLSGSPIRIANFCFYFLTPDLTATVPRTMSIQEDGSVAVSPSSNSGSVPAAVTSGGVAAVPMKKRKLSVSTAVPAVAGSGAGPTNSGKPSLISEIEDMSTVELLQQMTNAVEEQVWDRRHQLIGSTISCRAVLVAARDPHLYAVAMTHEGQLSRTEVMDWIAASPMFRMWVEQMLSKMEAKSYQASITKALIKAGFTRTASTGRYIKWHLPESLQNSSPPLDNDDHRASMGDDEDDDDDDDEINTENANETLNSQYTGAQHREQSNSFEDDDDEEEDQDEMDHGNSQLPDEPEEDENDDDDGDMNNHDNLKHHHMTTHSEQDDTDNRRSLLSDEHYF